MADDENASIGLSSREDLAALLQDRTDDEINAFVAAIGTDNVIGQVSAAIAERFDPEKAAGQNAVVQWDVVAPDGTHSFNLAIANGTCTLATGPADAPRVTLGFSLADFLRFIAGQLDGMQAFMGGKLKLTGDIMYAQVMQSFFATD